MEPGGSTAKDRISIHALREEGDSEGVADNPYTTISIHALREEGDRASSTTLTISPRFLSTPSARRATRDVPLFLRREIISIHALREEGDLHAAGYGVRSL